MKSNGLKSWWPGVSNRLKASPSCSKLITAEETEMPRSLDRHPIRAHPPLLSPRLDFAHQLIAVLPASGCGRGSDIISDLSRSTSQEQL
jgi:hypothetical protein